MRPVLPTAERARIVLRLAGLLRRGVALDPALEALSEELPRAAQRATRHALGLAREAKPQCASAFTAVARSAKIDRYLLDVSSRHAIIE